jgi:hypothetical protein
MTQIEVIRFSDEGYRQQRWLFSLDDRGPRLVLDRYSDGIKPPRRRRHEVLETWDRCDRRNNTIATPPLPDNVKQEALEKLLARLEVVTEMK